MFSLQKIVKAIHLDLHVAMQLPFGDFVAPWHPQFLNDLRACAQKPAKGFSTIGLEKAAWREWMWKTERVAAAAVAAVAVVVVALKRGR